MTDVPSIDFTACRDIADDSQKLGQVNGHCIAVYYSMDTANIRYIDCIGAVPAPAAGEVLVVIEHPMCPDDVACAIADAANGAVQNAPILDQRVYDFDDAESGYVPIGDYDMDDMDDPMDDVPEYFQGPSAGDFDSIEHMPDPFEPVSENKKDDGHGLLS